MSLRAAPHSLRRLAPAQPRGAAPTCSNRTGPARAAAGGALKPAPEPGEQGLLANEAHGGMAEWEMGCITGACAAFVAAVIWFAARRFWLWRMRRQDSRYRPATAIQTTGRDAWTGDDRETARQLHSVSGEEDMVRDADMIKAWAPRDDESIELQPRGAVRAAGCWAAFGTDGTCAGERTDTYACPQPSPGSRHAFAHRWSGPRMPSAGGLDRLSSPGCVPDEPSKKRSSPHYGRSASYLGDRGSRSDSAVSSPARHGLSFSFASAMPDRLSPLRYSPDASPAGPLVPARHFGAGNGNQASAGIPCFSRADAVANSDSARGDAATASDPNARYPGAIHEQTHEGEPPSYRCEQREVWGSSSSERDGDGGSENSVARENGARKSLTFAST